MPNKLSSHQLIRYMVGFVFIVSAIMKLAIADFTSAFISFGIPFPEITVWIVGITELIAGGLILANYYVKRATIPLLIIIVTAIILTKIPILPTGVFSFLFEARLDIVMFILLYILWKNEY
ncbi:MULTISPECIES: DoxX family protein [Gracilibacillus]|uniref:DoxX family membrane protein n=1 Tax=Gracilibacillus dipsosauri TaxID=178340 RepID=A0A317L243_9BACI|nr:DoxX family protein [Gracilibacillus dipsosauri]PWU69867.1 DoxX family membrane protein [Gracilibacillus dipsosauri]